MSENDDFFEGKRLWSRVKDNVLSDYMQPYLAKVNKRGQQILLIDGYAGPGMFEDGSWGSPLIICKKAEERAKGNYQAIFINNNKKYHDKLYQELQKRGWLGSAQPRLGDSKVLLPLLHSTLRNQTVLLYLDPFGPTGCDFELLLPFLNRNAALSTEIILTMNIPGMHRLAARHAIEAGRQEEPGIKHNHMLLTKIFGGNYWRDILLRQDGSSQEREMLLMATYQAKLTKHLPFTGSCPVREHTSGRIKYFIIFASRHPDALLLMNDIMAKAYFAGMHHADFSAGLWEGIDWREMRSIDGLDRVIIDTVMTHPGETRETLWFYIVQARFMHYLKTEYHTLIKSLVEERKIITPNPGKSGQPNEDSKLYLPNPT